MTTQPTVNFYILPDSDADNRHFFVFRLVEKAHDQQLKTLILAADNAQLHALDRVLWTADPARFIPHEILSGEPATLALPTIVLSETALLATSVGFQPDVVIDLSYDGTPLDFPKIMLVANQHAEILANARMKYQSYANQGIKPNVHKISEQQLALS